jgi:hypothetical protein
VAQAFPTSEISGIWVFAPIRKDDREWGTAAVARKSDDGRVRVYTAQYALVVKGVERGQGRVAVDEIGIGPDAALSEVLRGVQERAGELEAPIAIDPALWFGSADELAAAHG